MITDYPERGYLLRCTSRLGTFSRRLQTTDPLDSTTIALFCNNMLNACPQNQWLRTKAVE